MVPLGLTPLPIAGPEGETQQAPSAAWQDFVTAEAVSEVVAGGSISRLPVISGELALSSSEDDFAGIAGTPVISRASAAPAYFAPAIEWPEVVSTPVAMKAVARAKPPELQEWESAAPRVTLFGHRWWIPGLAGVAATMMFATVLLTMSNGPAPASGLVDIPKPEPLKPLRVADPTLIAPEDQPAVASASLLAP